MVKNIAPTIAFAVAVYCLCSSAVEKAISVWIPDHMLKHAVSYSPKFSSDMFAFCGFISLFAAVVLWK